MSPNANGSVDRRLTPTPRLLEAERLHVQSIAARDIADPQRRNHLLAADRRGPVHSSGAGVGKGTGTGGRSNAPGKSSLDLLLLAIPRLDVDPVDRSTLHLLVGGRSIVAACLEVRCVFVEDHLERRLRLLLVLHHTPPSERRDARVLDTEFERLPRRQEPTHGRRTEGHPVIRTEVVAGPPAAVRMEVDAVTLVVICEEVRVHVWLAVVPDRGQKAEGRLRDEAAHPRVVLAAVPSGEAGFARRPLPRRVRPTFSVTLRPLDNRVLATDGAKARGRR